MSCPSFITRSTTL